MVERWLYKPGILVQLKMGLFLLTKSCIYPGEKRIHSRVSSKTRFLKKVVDRPKNSAILIP